MKKLLSMILVAIMVTSCFVGCGSKGGGKGGDAKTIEIKYLKLGLGDEWLNAVIKGFEEKHPEYEVILTSSTSQEAVRTAFGMEDTDTTDLYLDAKVYDTKYLEPLDDVLNTTIEGESKTIKEKFDTSYLDLEKAADGKYYNLTYGGGMVGFVYNEKMFKEAGITTLPRTTDELALACETLIGNGNTPFAHFKPVGYWEAYLPDLFSVQYDGLNYVMNNFYGCTDENGNSPSLDVFTKKDGRYYGIEAFTKFITPETVLRGSNTYDHVNMQTKWLQGEAAMMFTGSWVENEMSNTANVENFSMMKSPVLSAITDKLSSIKTEGQLRKVITAIDSVSDGQKEVSEYKQGDNYVIDGLTVSVADWEYVKAARNTMCANYSLQSAYIPNYSNAKEGAKEFLKYLYSDEGYKIYTDTLNLIMPLSLSEGEVDTSKWSTFEKSQYDLYQSTEQWATEYIAGKHAIFTDGGATRWGSGTTYIDKFCSNNAAERLTAQAAWDDIVATIKDNYEKNWLVNMK